MAQSGSTDTHPPIEPGGDIVDQAPNYLMFGEFDASVLHDQRGDLSTANLGLDGTDSSGFFVTFAAQPALDGRFTVSGRMVEGEETLALIEAQAKDAEPGTPDVEIRIQSTSITFTEPD